MRIELPEGYVPPQPTHPHYGYLTPQERTELEASERAEGIVPGVEPEAGGAEAAVGAEVAAETPDHVEARPGWVPQPPAPPGVVPSPATSVPTVPTEPVEEAPVLAAAPVAEPVGAVAEMRWDAYRQEWVAVDETAPPPDVAAAAGGRGSSSSWTSANGQRFRWDARAQQWVTEGAGD